MSDYTELVKTLRNRNNWLCDDAAAAIEERQAEVKRLEPKRGEWHEWDDGDNTWACSVCGNPFVLIDGTPKDNGMNFCPNCGAKMEVQE